VTHEWNGCITSEVVCKHSAFQVVVNIENLSWHLSNENKYYSKIQNSTEDQTKRQITNFVDATEHMCTCSRVDNCMNLS
jgi:hypothetical protein